MVSNQMNIETTSINEHLLKSIIWRMHSRTNSFQIQLQFTDSFLKQRHAAEFKHRALLLFNNGLDFATPPTRRKYAKTTARKVLLGEFVVATAGCVDDLARCVRSRVNDGKAAPLSFTPST